MASQWNDRGIRVLTVGVLGTAFVSTTPTFVLMLLFHSSTVLNGWWGILLTAIALLVFEGGAIASKSLSIWIPKWEKPLFYFMITTLFMLFVTNGVSGWDSLQHSDTTPGSIYDIIKTTPVIAVMSVVFYAALFPVLQGIFLHAFVVRWNDIATDISENETLRNKLEQTRNEFETKWNDLQWQFQIVEQERNSLKQELQTIPITIPTTQLIIAKRPFTLEQFTMLLNEWLEEKYNVQTNETAVYRMISRTKEGE